MLPCRIFPQIYDGDLLSFFSSFIVKTGLAVLSQWPLGIPLVQPLSRISGMDTNSRIALHVPVQLHPELIVHVVAVHFSYDRQQQCQNAAEILQFIVGM